MFNLMMIASIIIIISSIVMKISILLSKKLKLDFEKMSPFECGFDPISSSRMPFSLRFFLITIIFLIFDVEIALLVPMIKTFFMSNITNWTITSFLFLIILLIGIYHEWNQGALNWTN